MCREYGVFGCEVEVGESKEGQKSVRREERLKMQRESKKKRSHDETGQKSRGCRTAMVCEECQDQRRMGTENSLETGLMRQV